MTRLVIVVYWSSTSEYISMEFHGTAGVIEIGALQVPWNSPVSAKMAHGRRK